MGPMKNATPKAHRTETNCTFAPASCGCSECAAARLPTGCPAGCGCLVCLVESLSGPAPQRAA